MALDPLVTWTNKPTEGNPTEVLEWSIGVVDAGTTSAITIFLIWNNFGGAEARKKMEDCSLGTRCKDGSHTGEGQEVVEGQWVEARSESSGDIGTDPFDAIGYNTAGSAFVEKDVKGHGQADWEVAGVINDGTYADGETKGNFVEVELQASPPIDASSGPKEFYTRFFYIFV